MTEIHQQTRQRLLELLSHGEHQQAIELMHALDWYDLSGADLRRQPLQGVDLSRVCFRGAQMGHTQLSNATLRNADLRQVEANDLWLDGADLSGADLRGARLLEAFAPQAVLVNADLRGVMLCGSELVGAHLVGANLTGADLRGVDFSHADLRRADLRGADLRSYEVDVGFGVKEFRGANLERARLQNATIDRDTRWPEGFAAYIPYWEMRLVGPRP